MKVFVTFERQIKELEIPDDKNFIGEVRKQACELFGVKVEEVLFRSGTRPIREDMPLRPEHAITMAKVKPPKQEEKEESSQYEYEEIYEEVSSNYDAYASQYYSDEDSEGMEDEPERE